VRTLLRRASAGAASALALAALSLLLQSCASARPEPVELHDARVAIQDAESAGARDGSPDLLAAARAHLANAENAYKVANDYDASVHYARLAETEARDAQYRAVTRRARAAVEAGLKRRAELEVAVRDAEIRARADAQRAADERVRLLQAQLDAERQKTAAEQQQAQIDALRAQVEEQRRAADEMRRASAQQVAAAQSAAEAEHARAEEARHAAEQAASREKSQADLLVRLQAIERSARVESRGIVLTLPGNVYFDTGRADVKPGAAERLARIAEALRGVTDRHLLVEGHTDSTGSAATNERLSAQRAEAVKSILVSNGLDPARIETHGYAATRPVATNATPAGRSENRRVEIVVQGGAR
jgi:outer membrane protein OmpA-like peptidoglycan-associated protein